MERIATLNTAKKLFGKNFICTNELIPIAERLSLKIPKIIPKIPYTLKELKEKYKDYILILGVSEITNGESLTLKSLRNSFGIDPDESEPCFYNQDWYLHEEFYLKALESKWFLLRRNIFDESRAINPDYLINNSNLPSAILCAYTFFAYWLYNRECLWANDFIWCTDIDKNGDRIYVGKYYDINSINKNGFSIHRHLRIRDNYGAIDVF